MSSLAALSVSLPAIATSQQAGATSEKKTLVSFQFEKSSLTVLPGTQVSVHWSPPLGAGDPNDDYFLVGGDLPDFASGQGLTWPSGTSTTVPSTSAVNHGWAWQTTAEALTVSIPADAAPGTSYELTLKSCHTTKCSSSSVRQTYLDVPPDASEWTSPAYDQADFEPAGAVPIDNGKALDPVFDTAGDVWTSSEFSNDLTEISGSGGANEAFADAANDQRGSATFKPFQSCSPSGACSRSDQSELSEEATDANGDIWFTFGGDYEYMGERRNHSEIVSFDPADDSFCTYLVPGNNNEVMGIAYANGFIWFTESVGGGSASLDGFDPTQMQCDGSSTYTLPQSVRLLTWPVSASGADLWPAQIAVDPTGTDLWVTDFQGFSASPNSCSQVSTADTCGEVDEVDVSDPQAPEISNQYLYPNANTYSPHGAEPWDVVADANYVYVIDYGDSNLIRIDKTSGQEVEVPLPLTTDDEQGYGLALYGGNLYFTLSDDARPSFGAMSTFGYIDLSSWADGSQPQSAVVYTGLSQDVDGGSASDFRGIAIDTCGAAVLTDRTQDVLVTPQVPSGTCPVFDVKR